MKRLHIISTCGAAMFASAPITAAQAAGLEDGTYRCVIESFAMHLGDIEIDGDVYRGPAYDGNYTGDYRFTVSQDGGIINWDGPLGGISAAGDVVSSQVRSDGFDIIIQNEDGNFQTISCFPNY